MVRPPQLSLGATPRAPAGGLASPRTTPWSHGGGFGVSHPQPVFQGGFGHPQGWAMVIRPSHIFLIIIFIFLKNNNILLFYIKRDMWQISGCWIRMDGEDLKKKSLGNFITIAGDLYSGVAWLLPFCRYGVPNHPCVPWGWFDHLICLNVGGWNHPKWVWGWPSHNSVFLGVAWPNLYFWPFVLCLCLV